MTEQDARRMIANHLSDSARMVSAFNLDEIGESALALAERLRQVAAYLRDDPPCPRK